MRYMYRACTFAVGACLLAFAFISGAGGSIRGDSGLAYGPNTRVAGYTVQTHGWAQFLMSTTVRQNEGNLRRIESKVSDGFLPADA